MLCATAATLRRRCCEDILGLAYLHTRRRHLLQFPPDKTLAPAPAVPILRPRRIILVRHGQSEGNVDETVHTRVPDPKIGLTPTGWAQAQACGVRIRELVSGDAGAGDDWKVYFYVSPYRRTLETLRGLGTAFERERIVGVREEPRLREQDFVPPSICEKEIFRTEKKCELRKKSVFVMGVSFTAFQMESQLQMFMTE